MDISPGFGGRGIAFPGGGGGRFGGGGASGTFDASVGGAAPSGGSGSFDLDLDDGWLLVLALLVLVLCLGGGAVWVIWQSPVILPDAALKVAVAAGLVRAARRGAAAGWAVHRVCLPATRLLDVVRICAK